MKKNLMKLSLAAMMAGVSAPAQANDLSLDQLPQLAVDYALPALDATYDYVSEHRYSLEAQQMVLELVLEAYSRSKIIGNAQTDAIPFPENGDAENLAKGAVVGAETIALAVAAYKGTRLTNRGLSALVRSNRMLTELRAARTEHRAARRALRNATDDAAKSAAREAMAIASAKISVARRGAPGLLRQGVVWTGATLRKVVVAGAGVVVFASVAGGNAAGIFFPENFNLVEDLIQNKIEEIDLQLMLAEEQD